MKRQRIAMTLTLNVIATLSAPALAEDARPRVGVSVSETSNSLGVHISAVDVGSPASQLRRVSDGHVLKLVPAQHCITHVNGALVPTPDAFVAAIAASPEQTTLRVYTYATTAWDDYAVNLTGKPTANPAARPAQPSHDSVTTQRQVITMQPRATVQSRRPSLFNWGVRPPEGNNWRPGDNTWLFQKKPTDPALKKAYNQQVFVEILFGVAAGLDAASAVSDSYTPTTPATGGGLFRGLDSIGRDSFNRNYSTNPDHAPFIHR